MCVPFTESHARSAEMFQNSADQPFSSPARVLAMARVGAFHYFQGFVVYAVGQPESLLPSDQM